VLSPAGLVFVHSVVKVRSARAKSLFRFPEYFTLLDVVASYSHGLNSSITKLMHDTLHHGHH